MLLLCLVSPTELLHEWHISVLKVPTCTKFYGILQTDVPVLLNVIFKNTMLIYYYMHIAYISECVKPLDNELPKI